MFSFINLSISIAAVGLKAAYLVDAILKRSIAETVDIVVLQLFRMPFFGYKLPLHPIGSCCVLFSALLRSETKELDSVLAFVYLS